MSEGERRNALSGSSLEALQAFSLTSSLLNSSSFSTVTSGDPPDGSSMEMNQSVNNDVGRGVSHNISHADRTLPHHRHELYYQHHPQNSHNQNNQHNSHNQHHPHNQHTLPPSPSTTLQLTTVTLPNDSFLFQPVSLGQKVLCKIIRRKQQGYGGLYPQYELYLEGAAGARYFLMSARRKKRTRGATYLISLNKPDSGDFDERVVGKVKSNFAGTLFTIYDSKRVGERNERASVMYETNVLGLNGPRKMTLLLPGVTDEGCIRPLSYRQGGCQLKQKYDSDGIADILVLRNKPPQWNEETQSYVLNFYNRVSQASVKNFQLVADFDYYIVMQFGRVGVDAFTMDFQYPLSAMQAFGIALTSFDPKLACE